MPRDATRNSLFAARMASGARVSETQMWLPSRSNAVIFFGESKREEMRRPFGSNRSKAGFPRPRMTKKTIKRDHEQVAGKNLGSRSGRRERHAPAGQGPDGAPGLPLDPHGRERAGSPARSR